MSVNGYRWPEELWLRAKELIDGGMTIKAAAREIGVDYSRLGAKARYERESQDARERKYARERAKRKSYYLPTSSYRPGKQPASSRPSEALIAARDARARITPRDLTAQLLGDPLPGYSALERRT